MLSLSFICLAGAVLLGTLLALPYLRGASVPPGWLVGVHATFGVAGLAALTLALRGPPRGLEQGTGSFGAISAALIAAALLAALGMLAGRLRRRRVSATLVGVHATLAVGGFVVLIVYVFG